MKYLLILTILITGCSSTPSVITKTEYVTNAPPAKMYELSAPVTLADTSTQRGIAEWIVKSEQRAQECEAAISNLKLYFINK